MNEDRKILAVDFGEKRIGLAMAINDLAEPLSIIEVDPPSPPPFAKASRGKQLRGVVQQIVDICEQRKIEKIVLGLPLNSQGQIGPAAKKVKKFGQKLAAATGLEIIFWDETLTSEEALSKMIEAGRRRKNRRHLDDVVAALILQEYLDSRGFKTD